jgi:ATP-dependent Clp protease ATP-binding subunit ClpX
MPDAAASAARDERDARIEERLQRVARFHWWPEDIAGQLGRHVIGQDDAVRRMATLLRAHVRRVQEAIEEGTALRPSGPAGETGPILLIGPSGCGKSLLIRTMAEMAALPWVIEDASGQTATGYVGRNVSDIVSHLISRSDGDIGLARWGIVGIDEFDKIRRRGAPHGLDVGGEGAQRSLLSLLDGGMVQFEWPPVGSRDSKAWFPFHCGSLMVVLAGAFEGLVDIVRRRLRIGVRRIGFGVSGTAKDGPADHEVLSQAAPEDLVAFGFLPEVVGRIREIVVMRPLAADDLRRILINAPEGPVAILQRMARREAFEFVPSDALVDGIVAEAMSRGLGARSLHAILSRVTQRALYEVPARVNPMSRGRSVVELGADALTDGSYELIHHRSRRSRKSPVEADQDPGDGS